MPQAVLAFGVAGAAARDHARLLKRQRGALACSSESTQARSTNIKAALGIGPVQCCRLCAAAGIVAMVHSRAIAAVPRLQLKHNAVLHVRTTPAHVRTTPAAKAQY